MRRFTIVCAILAFTAASPFRRNESGPTTSANHSILSQFIPDAYRPDDYLPHQDLPYDPPGFDLKSGDTRDGAPSEIQKFALIDSEDQNLEVNLLTSKEFLRHLPAEANVDLKYHHKFLDIGILVSGYYKAKEGVNLVVEGDWKAYKFGGIVLDVKGKYQQHLGGPSGNGVPVLEVEMKGQHGVKE